MFDRELKQKANQQINKRAGPAAATPVTSAAPVRSPATDTREDIGRQNGSKERHKANRHGLS